LSEEDNYDGEITVSECSDAVNKMKWNKSPVFDGVSVEFYKTLWDKLKYFLTKTYYKSLRTSVNIFTAFKCTSIAIQKRDPLLLDNFRPISLLNGDLKILFYVLAQRLKNILNKIINEDQTGLYKKQIYWV
jgi:hypothetical protein